MDVKDLKDLKLYGICVERLKHQIGIARGRQDLDKLSVVLESYCTSDMSEIVDLLELFDLDNHKRKTVLNKLDELARDVSLFVGEEVFFDFNEEKELCLCLRLAAARSESLLTKDDVNTAA